MIMQKPSKVPTVSPTAHVATNATVIGDVTIGDECCVLFNAAIRGDCDSFVRLGERTGTCGGRLSAREPRFAHDHRP